MHVKAYSSDLAQRYDSRHFGGRSGQHILQQDCAAIRQLLPPPPASVLDIPCGTGVYTAALRHGGYDVIAADASAPMLAIVGQHQDPGITRQCSIHDLLFAADSFDATLTLRVFSHFQPQEIAAALLELRRVIKPGGHIVFDTFRWTPRRWPLLRNFVAQSYIYEQAPHDVRALIEDAGLRTVQTQTRYLFSPIWQRKLPYPILRALTAAEAKLPDGWMLRTFWACTKDV